MTLSFAGRRDLTPVRGPAGVQSHIPWSGGPAHLEQRRQGARPASAPHPRLALEAWAASPHFALLLCVLELSPTPAQALPPSPSSPSRPGLISLPQSNVPSFSASGGGLVKGSKTRVWNASGKGTGLHTGPARVAANTPCEVAQDRGQSQGRAEPNAPLGKM